MIGPYFIMAVDVYSISSDERIKVGVIHFTYETHYPEVDWDQKASATFHTKKSKRPLVDILYGRLKRPLRR
jgi:hypothetical protein